MNKAILSLKYISIFSLFVLLLAGTYSCRPNEVYSKYGEIKDLKWYKADTLFFDIDSTVFEIGKPYTITINLSHNADYPYRNIWFFVYDDIENTSFEYIQKQFYIADEFGKWYGAGFGALYQIEILYKGAVVFCEKRNYRLKILHGMRDEPLEGIEKVGIKIENIK